MFLAELAGLHRTYIGSVERGERNLSLKNISAVAAALGLSGSKLLERAEGFWASATLLVREGGSERLRETVRLRAWRGETGVLPGCGPPGAVH